eukprot:1065347-Pelagomonas_calceolata.AAC.1
MKQECGVPFWKQGSPDAPARSVLGRWGWDRWRGSHCKHEARVRRMQNSVFQVRLTMLQDRWRGSHCRHEARVRRNGNWEAKGSGMWLRWGGREALACCRPKKRPVDVGLQHVGFQADGARKLNARVCYLHGDGSGGDGCAGDGEAGEGWERGELGRGGEGSIGGGGG